MVVDLLRMAQGVKSVMDFVSAVEDNARCGANQGG